MKTFFYLLLSLLLFSCSSSEKEKATALASTKPQSIGASDQVVIILDSTFRNTRFATRLDSLLQTPFPVTINYEPRFSVSYSEIYGWIGAKKKKHQIICPIILNNLVNDPLLQAIDDKSLQKVQTDENPFIFIKKDVYARNQQIVFLVAKSEQEFLQLLKTREKDFLALLEKQAVKTAYRKEIENKATKFQFENKKRTISYVVPQGFELELQKENFIWYRKAEMSLSQNLIISWGRLDEFLEVSDMVQWRDSLSHKYLYGNEDSSSYMVTETAKTPQINNFIINGNEARSLRGLWKLNERPMGGSFISYGIVDPKYKQFYYIEGFVYAPGEKKSNYLRSLDAILQTFSVK